MTNTTKQNPNQMKLISTYMKYKSDINGNPRYLLDMPCQFVDNKELKDNCPITLKQAKGFIYTYNANTAMSTNAYTMIVYSYNIADTINTLNSYITKLNQSN